MKSIFTGRGEGGPGPLGPSGSATGANHCIVEPSLIAIVIKLSLVYASLLLHNSPNSMSSLTVLVIENLE